MNTKFARKGISEAAQENRLHSQKKAPTILSFLVYRPAQKDLMVDYKSSLIFHYQDKRVRPPLPLGLCRKQHLGEPAQ